jgi:hypothetical protein
MLNRLFGKKKAKPETPFNAYNGTNPYVFVSYAHVDSHMVFPIIRELNKRGVLMWYDEGIESGEEWPQVIADRILACEKMLLFISPDSVKSHHVRQEINFANSKRKQILPVYIKPTQLNAGVEMTISVFQSVYYYAFKNNEGDFYSQVTKALAGDFVDAGAEVTFLANSGEALLRLDEYGDKTLPVVIHFSNREAFSIGRFDVSVGTKRSDFEFNADTKNISRRHAVFGYEDGAGYTVTDLGSKAGTWVNGRKIPPHTPQAIESGYHISFGNGGASYVFEV